MASNPAPPGVYGGSKCICGICNKNSTSEEKEIVTISKKEYDGLVDSSDKLAALEAGGVDNWEWYGDSLEEYFKEKEKRESK